MPSGSERKEQIVLSAVNRCCSVLFLWLFYSSSGCPPQRLCRTTPQNASDLGGLFCRTPVCYSSAGGGRHGFLRSATVFFCLSPATVPVGVRWHCVVFLTLQHWLCRLLLSLSFCFAALSNSLCISSVDLNELHSDPHLSPF